MYVVARLAFRSVGFFYVAQPSSYDVERTLVLTDFNGREETKNNYISALPKYMYDVQSSFLTMPM